MAGAHSGVYCPVLALATSLAADPRGRMADPSGGLKLLLVDLWARGEQGGPRVP